MVSTQESRMQDMWLQEIRDSQGDYEQEVMSGDEASNTHYNRCIKNPGHKQFIDINIFTSEHLPERYQSDQKLSDLVRAQADVTCLIKASYVSPDRTQTFPFYKYRGRSGFCRSGTGWIYDVRVYTEKDKGKEWYKPCPCHTSEPRSEWALVRISTASHVVFDKSEAEACKCYFFYDNVQQKLSDCPVLTGHVHWLSGRSADDVSEIWYYTHDMVLAQKLKKMRDHYVSLCGVLSRRYGPVRHAPKDRDTEENDDDMNKDDKTQVKPLNCKDKDNCYSGYRVEGNLSQLDDCANESSDSEDNLDSESENNDDNDDDDDDDYEETWDCELYNPEHGLVIIASHPHGYSKKVTLGYVTQRIAVDEYHHAECSYEYSTPTCRGSSGAPVFILGRKLGWTVHPHSGRARRQGSQQINHSGTYMDI